MTRPLSQRVMERIRQAASLYRRLVLALVWAGSGKTSTLREAAAHVGEPLVAINLELSRRLLDLNMRQPALQVQRVLEGIAAEAGNNCLLLDNTELLLDPMLLPEPLRLLRGLSRHRTVAMSWSGSVEDGHVSFAAPENPEHLRCALDSILAVRTETPA